MPSDLDEMDLNCLLVDVNGKYLEFFMATVFPKKRVNILRCFIMKENTAFSPDSSGFPVIRKVL